MDEFRYFEVDFTEKVNKKALIYASSKEEAKSFIRKDEYSEIDVHPISKELYTINSVKEMEIKESEGQKFLTYKNE